MRLNIRDKKDADLLTDKDVDDLNLLDYNMDYLIPDLNDDEIDDFTLTQPADPKKSRTLLFFSGVNVRSINEKVLIDKNIKAKRLNQVID